MEDFYDEVEVEDGKKEQIDKDEYNMKHFIDDSV